METYSTQITDYLLTQSWQIAILVAAVAAATWLLRNKSAHVRYLLWLIVLAKCLVPPLVTVPLAVLPQEKPTLLLELQTPSPMITEPVASAPAPQVNPQVPVVVPPRTRVDMRQWLAIAWITGVSIFVVVAVVKALQTICWLRRERKPLPAELHSSIEGLFRDFGGLPKLWLVDGIGQPFVWGLLRGSIYLPANFVKVNDAEYRRDILGHELSHILRFDAAVNLLQVMAQAVFWFHPFVWWANKKIRAEREKCCDEMAIARLGAKVKDYSSAIVNILVCEYESTRPVPSLAVAGPVKNIEERIKTMLRPGKKFYKRPNLISAAVVLLFALLTVPTALVLTARAEAKPERKTQAEREEKSTKSLPQAAADGNIDQVKLLISKGADVNAKDEKGNMALHYAAQRGRRYMIKLLLANGARVNEKNNDGDTALHYAAERHQKPNTKEVIELLLANGARVNEKNIHGETPAHAALKTPWPRGIVDLLIEKGADVSTIHLAAYTGDLSRVKSLVEILVEMGTNANVADRTGLTPLHAAATSGQKDVAEFLINKGANVNASDEIDRRPAFCAASEGHKNMVEFLIAKGADITDGQGEYYWTPLHAAVLGRNKDIVELVLDAGADINAMGKGDVTPLHYAVAGRDLDMVRLLIGHGAEVDVKIKRGATPLHWAARAGSSEVVELLISKGADVNAEDRSGTTPLAVAKEAGHEEIVELLLKHGAKE